MGTNVSLNIEDLPKELELGEKRVRDAIARAARTGAEKARAILVRATPTDRGELRASWKVKRIATLVAGFETELAELINDAPHAGIVELGARPHGVSPEGWQAIYEWVRRHPDLYGMKKARTKVSATPLQQAALGPFKGIDPDISRITDAIAAKFRKSGQQPTYFVRSKLDDVRDALAAELDRQLDLAARAAGKRGG